MNELITIWIRQLISSIGIGMTLVSLAAEIFMFIFAFIFGSKKSIYEIEGSIR